MMCESMSFASGPDGLMADVLAQSEMPDIKDQVRAILNFAPKTQIQILQIMDFMDNGGEMSHSASNSSLDSLDTSSSLSSSVGGSTTSLNAHVRNRNLSLFSPVAVSPKRRLQALQQMRIHHGSTPDVSVISQQPTSVAAPTAPPPQQTMQYKYASHFRVPRVTDR